MVERVSPERVSPRKMTVSCLHAEGLGQAHCMARENQPVGVDSKPANLRCFIHIWFLEAIKGFSTTLFLLAHTLPNESPLCSLDESQP